MIVWDTEAERADVRAQRTIGSEQGVAIDDVAWEMEEASICGLGMVAASPLQSARRFFPELFEKPGDGGEGR